MNIETTHTSTSLQHLDTIISDIQEHIDKKQDFVGFILLSIGIEFLGSFSDSQDFNEFGEAGVRFKNGLRLFKDVWYKNKLDWVYKQFRGPLIHQYRTGNEIYLTSFCKNGTLLSKHKSQEGEKTIFVLEQLFEDYKIAVNSLKTKVNRPHNLSTKKINQNYASIHIIMTENTETAHSFSVSGTHETQNVKFENPELYSYQPVKKSKKEKKRKK